MPCTTHDWRPTGEQGKHTDFTYTRGNGRHDQCVVMAAYVCCSTCKQRGFRNIRRPQSRVVYTWTNT